MGVSALLCLMFVVQCVVFTNGRHRDKFFRKDYTYLSSTQSFYKLQTSSNTWGEAKKRCEMEGATLFHPKDDNEASEVIAFWNQTHPSWAVYVGLNDLLVEGDFQTVDGQSAADVYSNWSPGEPNDSGGIEDCVGLRHDGTLNDVPCNMKFPFICKKALEDVHWSQECNFSRTDYIYNKNLDRCYKFHARPKNWTEAITVCSAEESHLAIINTLEEADYLVQLTQLKKKDNAPGLTMRGQVLLGFHDRFGDGWKTIKGQAVEDSGYSDWGSDQPSGEGHCGSMFYNGKLNDLPCHYRCFFICEHAIGSLIDDIDLQHIQLL